MKRIWVYRLLEKNHLFCNYVKMLRKRVELYHPNAMEAVLQKTSDIICLTFGSSILILLILLRMGDFSFYYMLLCVSAFGIFHVQLIYGIFAKEEFHLLKAFEKYLTDVRFYFGFHGNIEEAVLEAAEENETVIGLHSEVIYKLLLEEKEAVETYKCCSPNAFFSEFYILCETVMKYGDKKINGKSLFLTNLSYLKEDVYVEILRRQKEEYLFAGLAIVTIAPLFFIKPIEWFAVGSTSSMEIYYTGEIGITTTLIVCFLSLASYYIIYRLRYEIKAMKSDGSIASAVLELEPVKKVIQKLIEGNYGYFLRRNEYLKRLGSKDSINLFLVKQLMCAMMSFFFANFLFLYTFTIHGKKKYTVFFLFLSVIIAAAAYQIPYLKIYFRKQILRMEREAEVIRFQSVILILMHMEQISVEMILQWLEEFSEAFRDTLSEALENIEFYGMEVLEHMRERETFLPFLRLINGLLACDKVPIYEAFDEIEADRNYYIEKQKQENEALVSDKALIAKTIAFLPFIVTIALKLIVPFVLEGLRELSAFSNYFNI